MRLLIILPILCIVTNLKAQNDTELRTGRIIDAVNNQPLSFASVWQTSLPMNATIANEEGFFKIKIEGNAGIKISSVGYYDTTLTVSDTQSKNSILLISMRPKPNILDDVVVKVASGIFKTIGNTAKPLEDRIRPTEIGVKNQPEIFSSDEGIGLPELGIYLPVNPKNKGYLESVNFYLEKVFDKDAILLVRFISIEGGNFKAMRMNSVTSERIRLYKPIPAKELEMGWNKLNVSNLGLRLGRNAYLISFVMINKDGSPYVQKSNITGYVGNVSGLAFREVPKNYPLRLGFFDPTRSIFSIFDLKWATKLPCVYFRYRAGY
jgi:hypothetical protein